MEALLSRVRSSLADRRTSRDARVVRQRMQTRGGSQPGAALGAFGGGQASGAGCDAGGSGSSC